MSVTPLRRHLGEWISVRFRAERTPPRLTLTVTFGEFPAGWTRGARTAQTWAAVAGLVLIAPFTIALVAGVLRGAGYGQPYDWLAREPIAILAATISLFIGIPVAIAMNLWRVTRLGVRREPGGLDGLLAVEFAPLHLAVLAAAVAIGAVFAGHLAADSYACLNGVRSAC